MSVKLTFSDRIDDLIAEKKKEGMTEGRIAKELGIQPPTLTAYKNGDRTPIYDNLLRISEYFGVSMDWLAGRSEYREIDQRYLSVESLGLSDKSVKCLQAIMGNNNEGKQLDYLLSSMYLPMILQISHKYRKASFAMSLVVEADNHNVPLCDTVVDDEEVQKMVKAFELSRDNESDAAKYFNAAFGIFGVINPPGALKYELTTTVEMMLLEIYGSINEQVKQIVKRELDRD